MAINRMEALSNAAQVDVLKSSPRSFIWNGREVVFATTRDYPLTPIIQLYANALQQKENIENMPSRKYELFDFNEDDLDETFMDLAVESPHHPLGQEFTLADPSQHQPDIAQSKNIIKSTVKGVKKCTKKTAKGIKKVGKGVKKIAEKVFDFVKEHKTEVLVGLGIAVAAVGVYGLAGGFSGPSSAPETIDVTPKKREDEEDPAAQKPDLIPTESTPSPQDNAKVITVLDIAPPVKSRLDSFLGSLEKVLSTANPANMPSNNYPFLSDVIIPSIQSTRNVIKSCQIPMEGIRYLDRELGFINGMNTSLVEGYSHLKYTQRSAGDLASQGVYNHSNGAIGDLFEIFALNYAGIAPITADLLIENWTQFHERNKDNPNAKYLQITHSMGNILAKAALQRAPAEIRERVIILAIAPAVVIPKGLCHKSFHYASKNDIVHYGEDLHTLSTAGFDDEPGRKELLEQLAENKQRLILLDPHPDATGIDHDCESPTFKERIDRHIQDYLIGRSQ